jgi:hypothetical protein
MIKGTKYIIKASWSQNFGTYHTTDEEQSTGITNPGSYGIFGKKDQLSVSIALTRMLSQNIGIGITGASDYGELYYNSTGLLLGFSYVFQ